MIKCLLKKKHIFSVLCRAVVNIVLKIEPNRINILEGHLRLTEKIIFVLIMYQENLTKKFFPLPQSN